MKEHGIAVAYPEVRHLYPLFHEPVRHFQRAKALQCRCVNDGSTRRILSLGKSVDNDEVDPPFGQSDRRCETGRTSAGDKDLG